MLPLTYSLLLLVAVQQIAAVSCLPLAVHPYVVGLLLRTFASGLYDAQFNRSSLSLSLALSSSFAQLGRCRTVGTAQQAAITKSHRLGVLNNSKLHTVLEVRSQGLDVSMFDFSGDLSLLGLRLAIFLLCPHVAFFFFCASIAQVSLSFILRMPVRLDQGAHTWDLLKALSPNAITVGVSALIHEFGGDTNQSITITLITFLRMDHLYDIFFLFYVRWDITMFAIYLLHSI